MPAALPPLLPPGQLNHAEQPVLTIDELRLRPWAAADAPVLTSAYQDPAIQRWHVRTVTPAEAIELIESKNQAWQSETAADWAVADQDGRVLGRIALNHLNLYEGVAEFAYWTVPAARGRSVAVRAVQAATDWAFSIGFHRLTLRHATQNTASCRVADKSGYAFEGTQRLDGRHADGWHDMHLHARLNPAHEG